MRQALVLVGVFVVAFTSLAQSADVQVSKTGAIQTVTAGLAAAGAGGTVTIVDSATYVEDVTITQIGVTVQAATGQQPTIEAENVVNRYAAAGCVTNDHFGVSVQAPCTLIGLAIANPSAAVNRVVIPGVFDDELAASAIIVNSPNVTLRDCHIIGPTTGFGGGLWSTCLLVDLSGIPASLSLENCEIEGGQYGLVNQTFGEYIPGPADSSLTANGCSVHHTTAGGVESDAGVLTLTDCIIRDNENHGVIVGGGSATLTTCDIRDNGGSGLALEFNADFAHPGDWARVTASDCLIIRNGPGDGQDFGVRVYTGRLDIDHSIIALGNDRGGVFLDDNDPAVAAINMDFCDIYVPGQDCFAFGQDVFQQPVVASVKNTIMVGRNGMLNPNAGFNDCNICFSDLWITGTAVQDVATSNNVTIDPVYRLPTFPQRDPATGKIPGFQYFNSNLNVGEGAANIGSQGQYIPDKPLRGRSWFRYE